MKQDVNQLTDFIMLLSEEYDGISERILYAFSEDINRVRAVVDLMESIIEEECKDFGEIGDLDHALTGVYKAMDLAYTLSNEHEIYPAIELYLKIHDTINEYFMIFYEGSDSVKEIEMDIYGSIKSLLKSDFDRLSEEEQNDLFHNFLNRATYQREAFSCATLFSHEDRFLNELNLFIYELEKSDSENTVFYFHYE